MMWTLSGLRNVPSWSSRFVPNVVSLSRPKSFSEQRFQSIIGPRAARHLSSTVRKSSRLPLEGITVVSLEQAIAAPLCTRHLGDLGARVIKVERPGEGDFARSYDTRARGMSSHFVWVNRNKESLALDLKKEKDLAVLKKLLGKTDVLVQNLAPGAAARLGLSFEELSPKHPSLIVCDISGYGHDGPYRQKRAYDLLIQSESGVLSVTGKPGEPAKVGVSIADISAGMYAYSNILAAIIQRNKSTDGRGCRIDISMLESMVEWMGFPLYYTCDDAPSPIPAGASHASIYPYGPFDTGADGGSVMLGIQNDREWVKLCEIVLNDASLATDSRFKNNMLRSQNREALKHLIEQIFTKLTATEAQERLDEAGIANAKVNDMKGVWKHPQLQARNRWTEIKTPTGTLPALYPPGFFPKNDADDSRLEVQLGAVPTVGEHNDKLSEELGMK